MPEFNEADHPRDDDGKFTRGGPHTLKSIQLLAKEGDIYVRWSRGPKYDLQEGAKSRDYQSGETHAGLSAAHLDPDLGIGGIASQISEYEFLRMKDKKLKPYFYKANKVGEDTDRHASIKPVEYLGTLETRTAKSLEMGGYKAIVLKEKIEEARHRLNKIERGSIGESIVMKSLEKLEKELAELNPKMMERADSQGFREVFGDIIGPLPSTVKPMKAAGILYRDRAGERVLLIRRAMDAHDFPGYWDLPGGRLDGDEDHMAAAIRESGEEIGFIPSADEPLRPFNLKTSPTVQYATFAADVQPFTPALNAEHTDWQWAPLSQLPSPLHPGVAADLEKLTAPVVTELEIAQKIRDGLLPSPQRFENVWLWAMRITGTGMAYRTALAEHVFRNPVNYLNEEFLARCNGLTVIWEHPDPEKDKTGKLNHEQFVKRAIGAIFLPYIRGSEVWGIARIYDDNAAQEMLTTELSTSPMVLFRNPELNDTIPLVDGSSLLIEDKPSLLDHLAVCPAGVWDKGGEPSGIISEHFEETEMVDKVTDSAAAADADKAKGAPDIATMFQTLLSRADAQDAKIDKLMTRADADDKDGEKVKADADKDPDEKADADETDDEKAEREAKEKADADEMAAKEKADADVKAKERADSQSAIDQRFAALEGRLPKPVTDADHAEFSTAQARADGVYTAFGKRAPGALAGETPLAYRRRLVSPFRTHSKDFGAIDLATITDPVGFAAIEGKIYADAQAAAHDPASVVSGQLREIRKQSAGGHTIVEFVGNPGDCWAPFKSRSQQLAGINKEFH